jgi:hypothetical protein
VNISDARRASFKVVLSNGHDEVLARAMNLLIARGAYREAAGLYPEDLIELRQGARVIEKSKCLNSGSGVRGAPMGTRPRTLGSGSSNRHSASTYSSLAPRRPRLPRSPPR